MLNKIKIILLIASLFASSAAFAQSLAPQDDFLGRTDISCPAPTHRANATFCATACSGTTVTFTYVNATITNDPLTLNGNQYDYDVTISSPALSFRIALDEPIIIGGTSTALDWHFVNDQLQGGYYITGVNTSTGVITLFSDQTLGTINSTSGWAEPATYYNPFSQSTTINTVTQAAQFTVNVPGRGTTYPVCDPESHYVYIEANSAFCDANTNCDSPTSQNLSTTVGAITESGGVVTAPATLTLPTITGGTTTATISGVSDATYDTSAITVQSNPSAGVITYNQSTTNSTAIGGYVTFSSPTSGPYMLISESQTGGVVTATFSQFLSMGIGSPVSLTGVGDASYNCNYNITGEAGNVLSLTPASGCTPDGAATQGGSAKLNGYLTWPARYSSQGQADLGLVSTALALGFNASGEDSTINVFNNSGNPSGGWPTNQNRWPALSPVAGTVLSPSLYALSNRNGYVSQAVHNLVAGIDHNWPATFNGITVDEPDWPDANFLTFGLDWNAPTGQGGQSNVGAYRSMSSIGVMADDTDVNNYPYSGAMWWGIQNSIIGQGGAGGLNVGMIAAISDPHQVAANRNAYGLLNPIFYPTDTVYAKTLSGTQPVGCWAAVTLTAPSGRPVNSTEPICGSWDDWERNWYGSVATMNSAYGSNYTSFGSNETAVAQASPSGWTGNGSTTSYSTTLNTNVTPGSLHIYMQPGGSGQIYLISGDCPYWPTSANGGSNNSGGNGCPTLSAGEGSIMEATSTWPGGKSNNTSVATGYLFTDTGNNCLWYATNGGALAATWTASSCSGTFLSGAVTWQAVGPYIVQSTSNVTYQTGVLNLNFNSAVASGTKIYVSYTYNGFDTVNGTGLADDDGQDTGCGFACGMVNTSGTVATRVSGATIPTGSQWNGVEVTVNGTIYQIASTTSTTFTTTASMGTQSSVSYNVNGFGNNQICLLNPPVWTATTAETAYSSIVADTNSPPDWFIATASGTTGATQPSGFVPVTSANWGYAVTGDGTVSWQAIGPAFCNVTNGNWKAVVNMQQNLATDLVNYVGYGLGAAYLNADYKMGEALYPDRLQLGTNFGPMNYDAPSYYTILQMYDWFTDMVFINTFPIQSVDTRGIGATYDPVEPAKYKYFTNFYNKNIAEEDFPIVSAGFDETCINEKSYCINSMVGRSEEYYDMTNIALQATDPSGIFRNAAQTWWGNLGFQSKSFGYLDKSGNAPNGHDNVAASVACQYFSSTNCGGEVGFPSIGVDAVNCQFCLLNANKLWLLQTNTPLGKPNPAVIWGIKVNHEKTEAAPK